MAMLVARSDSPLSIIDRSFKETKINIPKAPALGLLLDQPLFDHYNQRVENRSDREPIRFDKFKVYYIFRFLLFFFCPRLRTTRKINKCYANHLKQITK